MADFYLTQGDSLPSIEATLKDATGAAVDLTNAQTITFQMKQITGGSASFEKAVVIVSAVDGQVRYDFGATDADALGSYHARFKVIWQNGKITSFPNTAPLTVSIAAKLD